MERDGQAKNHNGSSADSPPFVAIAGATACAALLLLVYGLTAKTSASPSTVFAVEMLVGTAAFVAGALLGFLFGIPRTPPRGAGGTNANAVAVDRAVYEPSNNLEQVSDWLTKVLVGATLVQLRDLRLTLAVAGLRVMEGLGGTATSVVTQLTIVAFGILGFLAGFLWTRVYYGVIQVRADQNAFALLEEVKKEVKDLSRQVEDSKKQSEELVSQSEQARAQAQETARAATKLLQSQGTSEVGPLQNAAAVEVDPDLQTQVARFKNAPAIWESDPVADIFGSGPSSKDGLTLSGSIETVLDGESLILTLGVEGTGNRRLEGTVLFLLHPTYAQSTRTVLARNNRATVTVYSESWYCAAAIVGTTVLVLDLRTIAGAPEWFTKE